jgi:hypothetical protein
MKVLGTVFVLFVVLVSGSGCTSDPDTPLGSEFRENGLIKSRPGEVFQDTIAVEAGDTSFVAGSVMFNSNKMEFGRKDDVESWPILRVDFSTAGDDTLLDVESATLSLTVEDTTSVTLEAVFRELAETLVDSDTLKSITLVDTIPDEKLAVDRLMSYSPRTYLLRPKLVQDWIRKERPHNGIVIELTDATTTERLAFAGTERGSGLRPTLKVIFTNGDESTYLMTVDGSFVRDFVATSNLLLSDGVARRVYIPFGLTVFDPRTLLHEARLVLHVVPGSFVADDTAAVVVALYAPTSLEINDPDVLTGTPVTLALLKPDSDVLNLSVRNILSTLISERKTETALVLRCDAEGASIRRVEFYTSEAADSLRPSLSFTYSTAPTFAK